MDEALREDWKQAWKAEVARAEAAKAEVARLQKIVSEYDHVITWDTTCANCANLLDRCYSETMRAEKAEAQRDGWRQCAENLNRAIDVALHELGVPGVGYPAPVTNAVDVLRHARMKPDRLVAEQEG